MTTRAKLLVALLAATPAQADPFTRAQPNATPDQAYATCTVDDWWSYNRACCCTTGWCAPLPPGRVTRTATGWQLTLQPGDHPRITTETIWHVPYEHALRSLDERFHLCTGGLAPRCFLAPTGTN